MIRLVLLFFAGLISAVAITGCTYHEHYYGEERMVDEGIVVQEEYIVE